MANETILVVDADPKSQKVLEVSFKKAGYRVVMTETPAAAHEVARSGAVDLVVSETTFEDGDGFDFLTELREGEHRSVPFIFLTEDRSLPQKMRAFELGADDYLTKPVYIKEVTTRVELLLQKRAKDALLEDDVEELEGNLADITMIDLLQTIEDELRSGTIHLSSGTQAAVIYFRQGNILDAICGKLQGEEAIYRLMLWPEGEFTLRYHEQVNRADRIEKDSGALLLEGIRRLDQYNELLAKLPDLDHVFEANYAKLGDALKSLPTEAGLVVRLFDGIRSVAEVADHSPLDDVTTLKIIARLIQDGLIVDVTPATASRERMPSRSNLAAWLDGMRSQSDDEPRSLAAARETTSPKFGASIAGMVEKREPDAIRKRPTQPNAMGRRQTQNGRSIRSTDPFVGMHVLDEEEEEVDPRRKTNVQWDIRPKSEWNIHMDSGSDADAAIREIEEEERRRREHEARQLSGKEPPSRASRKKTLQQVKTVNRASGGLEELEAEEQRRRDEEARRLKAQLSSLGHESGPVSPAIRRPTGEMEAQSREAEPEDVRDTVPDGDGGARTRGRISTPLSGPASLASYLDENEGHPAMGLDAGVVSEADVFEDESDETDRGDEREIRATLDIRPPAHLTALGEASSSDDVTPDIDDAGLFASLAEEETAPGDDESMVDVQVLEVLQNVPRQAVDRQLEKREYDLTKRTTIAPHEIAGRVAERETVELTKDDTPRALAKTAEGEEFFRERLSTDQFDAFHQEREERPSTAAVAFLAVLIVAVVGLLWFMTTTGDDEGVDEVAQVKTEPTPEPPEPVVPPVPVEEPPEVTPTLVALDEVGAEQAATELGTGVGMSTQELALVMSGADLLPPETDPTLTDDPPPVVDTPPDAVAAKDPAPKDPTPPTSKAVTPPPKTSKSDVPEVAVPSEVKASDIAKAKRLIRSGKYDDALGLLRALSKADASNQEVALLHGQAAFNSNRTSEAANYLAKAERLGHREAPLYLDLAAAYQLDGKPHKAKWAYEKFLKLEPKGRKADEVRNILSTQF